jgi:predicted dehydrogenase
MGGNWKRRSFLAASAASAIGLAGAGPRLMNKETQLRVACVGLGKRGEVNATITIGEQMVALCDVDEGLLLPWIDRFPGSKPYSDWRELIEKETIDALIISTPDHLHAHIALAAMNKGIHVYVETPVAHNMLEVRRLVKKAKEKNVVAFMGNQYHASAGYVRARELLDAKTIGEVKEVHAWTYRPSWAQGVKRPADGYPPPPKLNWDLWLGPSLERPYHPIYHPTGWRGWWDFGCGALGDMGPHMLDPIFWALKLDYPTTISAETSNDGNLDVAPSWSKVHFEFAARGDMPALKLTWYDGGQKPPAEILSPHYEQPPANGVMVVGELGRMFIPDLGRNPRVIPNTRGELLQEPELKATPSRGLHQEWLDACRTKQPNHDHFANCCKLTEICHMGNIAVKTGKKLEWSTQKNMFVNNPDANRLVRRAYRSGWELPK